MNSVTHSKRTATWYHSSFMWIEIRADHSTTKNVNQCLYTFMNWNKNTSFAAHSWTLSFKFEKNKRKKHTKSILKWRKTQSHARSARFRSISNQNLPNEVSASRKKSPQSYWKTLSVVTSQRKYRSQRLAIKFRCTHTADIHFKRSLSIISERRQVIRARNKNRSQKTTFYSNVAQFIQKKKHNNNNNKTTTHFVASDKKRLNLENWFRFK